MRSEGSAVLRYLPRCTLLLMWTGLEARTVGVVSPTPARTSIKGEIPQRRLLGNSLTEVFGSTMKLVYFRKWGWTQFFFFVVPHASHSVATKPVSLRRAISTDPGRADCCPWVADNRVCSAIEDTTSTVPVSYTHLTLPTIYSV